MNADRRKRLSEAEDLISQAHDLIEAVEQEEGQAADNMEEHFPMSEKAEQLMDNANMLEEIRDELDTRRSQIQDLIEQSPFRSRRPDFPGA